MNPSTPIDPAVSATHQALFNTWFPIDELPLDPRIRPDIAAIAAQVDAGMLKSFSQSPFLKLLQAMTYPKGLPFFDCLAQSKNAAVQAFVTTAGGFGAIAAAQRLPLFAFFFEASCGPATAQVAMQLREAYLAGIWDLPLAIPLTEIETPQVFMPNVEVYAKHHAPRIPPSRLAYDPATKTISHKDGPIHYLVIGSGPGGAAVAQQLHESGKRVVVMERGPFVVWGSMDTRSYSTLMFQNNVAATSDNGILIRSGQTLGGGSTVNIDLAFSPLEATCLSRIENWAQQGWIDAKYYTPERIAAAYHWVTTIIETREVSQTELDRDNLALWDGARAFGVTPSLYHLNRYPVGLSPSPVDDKKDAARQLLMPAIEDSANPLSVIPDAIVDAVQFEPLPDGNVRATGVTFTATAPWTEYGNTVVDPCNLQIPAGTSVSIAAENVILAAGTIGTTRVLLNTASSTPAVNNPRIGRGLILHPSVPLIGVCDQTINLLEGLDSASFVDSFGVTPGFIFETMAGLPSYAAALIQGTGKQVFEHIVQFDNSVGFGVMLVDTPYDNNRVTLDAQGNVVLEYALSDSDKQRFRIGVAIAIRMMFLAGAKIVIVPSNENLLGQSDFDPTQGVYLTHIDQADLVEKNLNFIPNRTILTSAHLQASNKIGSSPDMSVVSTHQRVWNVQTRQEVPNLYVMDSSIFPTSVGANPMQSIYTFARIFAERLILGMDHDAPARMIAARSDRKPPVIAPIRSTASAGS